MIPRRLSLRDERGSVTIAELLMGMFVFVIVFGAILTMVEGAMKQNTKVTTRVYANQKARPVLTRIVDTLHSSCVAPGIAPVLAGSTSSQIQFISKIGREVSPTPDKRVITLTGNNLTEAVYPATGGAPPTWTFSTTPTSNRILLRGVSAGQTGSPSVSVPLFRYYKYVNGQVSATPLPVPLSAADAATAVLVEIAFAVSPSGTPSTNAASRVTLTDSTTLRLEPASEDSAELNLPCV